MASNKEIIESVINVISGNIHVPAFARADLIARVQGLLDVEEAQTEEKTEAQETAG